MKMNEGLPLPPGLAMKMKATMQNPLYHAEGDVYRHTELVLERFFEWKDEFSLTESEERILYWACILHDAGKAYTTIQENGNWRAPGHETAGVPIARDILLQRDDVSAEERRKILSLVRYHYYPFLWLRKIQDREALRLFATRTDLRLLSIFSLFDFGGRIAVDRDESIRSLRAFREQEAGRILYEWGSFDAMQEAFSAWDLAKRNAAWSAIRLGKPDLLSVLFQASRFTPEAKTRPVVKLLIGPALSGKSHYLQTHHPDAFVVRLEEFMIGDDFPADTWSLDRRATEFGYMLSIYMKHHPVVYVEGRVLTEAIREKLNLVFRNLNAEIHYLFFETTPDELRKRNAAREQPLTEEYLLGHYRSMLEPHSWEAHYMEWVIG